MTYHLEQAKFRSYSAFETRFLTLLGVNLHPSAQDTFWASSIAKDNNQLLEAI
jgi:hypothetical protein